MLYQKSLYHWTLTIRLSKRQVRTFQFTTADINNLHEQGKLMPGHQHLVSDTPSDSSPKSDLPPPTPKLRTHDIPISSIPKDVTFTIDQIQRRFGFRNVNNIIKQIQETSQPNFSLSSSDQEPIMDLGITSTIDKSKRNTTPLTLPTKFGDAVHIDILYGSATAHGQIKYELYLIDRATRYKAIYPIKDLSQDILPAIQQYFNEMGSIPSQFVSDCDQRLFSQEIQEWLTDNNSRINSTPEGKQRQNGLAVGTWKNILRMARGWIASSLLSPTY